MKYTHIIFDIDGTLLDTEYAILQSLQQTLKTVTNKIYDLSELKFVLGIPGKDALQKLFIEDVSSALSLWEHNLTLYADSVKLFDDIKELLEQLAAMGYKMGIVTSKTRKEFNDEFFKYGIDSFFKTVICADDTKEHKPTPAPLFKYMELTGTSKENLLYIGDSEYDLKCAKNADVDFALARWGSYLPENVDATYILFHPLDLISNIKAM